MAVSPYHRSAKTRAAVAAVAGWLRDDAVPRPVAPNSRRRCARRPDAGRGGPGADAVELRVPPFVAVQCVAGLTHTRGNPPNVVETDPRTWLLLATGLASITETAANGALRMSGSRAVEIAESLPLVSLPD